MVKVDSEPWADNLVWGEKMCQLKPHETIKGAFIWSCIDFSDIDVDQKLTTFLARFKTPEGKVSKAKLTSRKRQIQRKYGEAVPREPGAGLGREET